MRTKEGTALRLILGLVLAGTLLGGAMPASADDGDHCPSGKTPQFVFGFADLSALLGDSMGAAATCEFPDSRGTGDVHQQTRTGLAFWRKSTNTPTFTNGSEHWALTSRGLVYWQGSGIDPPANADDAPSRFAPTSYIWPTIAPPNDEVHLGGVQPGRDEGEPEAKFWCLARNPTCSDTSPWWAEWNQPQGNDFVQYAFVGPGLETERRFIEAIWWVWQWPEGQGILKDAGAHGLAITTASQADGVAFAGFNPTRRVIQVNPDFTEASTWMVADVLAHEMKHAADDSAGLYGTASFSDCITREQRAYGVEQRFLRWLSQRFGGLPSAGQVAARLSLSDHDLFQNLDVLAHSSDVAAQAFNDYRKHCAL
ncbi:MAG TPA: hypothetical protein VKV73_22700 [Chloroflexota bacterium]|nr:hypothetical protein [Chloroflexota bacterium]